MHITKQNPIFITRPKNELPTFFHRNPGEDFSDQNLNLPHAEFEYFLHMSFVTFWAAPELGKVSRKGKEKEWIIHCLRKKIQTNWVGSQIWMEGIQKSSPSSGIINYFPLLPLFYVEKVGDIIQRPSSCLFHPINSSFSNIFLPYFHFRSESSSWYLMNLRFWR